MTNDSTLFDLNSAFTRPVQIGREKLSGRQLRDRDVFLKWLDVAAGEAALKFQLTPNEKKLVKSQRQLLETAIKQHAETLRELERINKQMRVALEAVQRDPGEKAAREDAEKAVNQLSGVLQLITADANLLSRLEKHNAVFKRLEN